MTTQLRNHSGAFVKPEMPANFDAAYVADWAAPNFAADMVDLPGADVWPIAGPNFTLLPPTRRRRRSRRSRNAMRFFDWAFNNGDELARRMGNASLPDALNKAVHEAWLAIKDPSGRPIWGA